MAGTASCEKTMDRTPTSGYKSHEWSVFGGGIRGFEIGYED
jgi:hypothetical protein